MANKLAVMVGAGAALCLAGTAQAQTVIEGDVIVDPSAVATAGATANGGTGVGYGGNVGDLTQVTVSDARGGEANATGGTGGNVNFSGGDYMNPATPGTVVGSVSQNGCTYTVGWSVGGFWVSFARQDGRYNAECAQREHMLTVLQTVLTQTNQDPRIVAAAIEGFADANAYFNNGLYHVQATEQYFLDRGLPLPRCAWGYLRTDRTLRSASARPQ